MENFTPIPALIGGGLIGLSASLLWLFRGRTAGISGILAGLVQLNQRDTRHRLLFLFGLLTGGVILSFVYPTSLIISNTRSVPLLILAGLFVGVGTRIGSGCTSGHGVCGLSKFSKRSLIATVSFMFTGFVTATFLLRMGL